MFLKGEGFKKLLKEAYNGGGLRVGNDGQGIFLYGGYWGVWIKQGCIPKKELAAIIELTGEIPETGKAFKSTKSGNQYELEDNPLYKAMENARQCSTYLRVTKLAFCYPSGIKARILQNTASGEIHLVNEKFIEMVSSEEAEFDKGETAAAGPVVGPFPGVFWFNNVMALHVMTRTDEDAKETIKHLEMIEIAEQK